MFVEFLKKNSKKLSAVLADILILVFALVGKPFVRWIMDNYSGCALYKNFGIKCFSCGGTRCVYSVLNGDFLEGLKYNASVFIVGIFAVLAVVLMNLAWIFGIKKAEKLLKSLLNIKLFFVFFIMVGIYSILRNIFPTIL